jgi:predicted metal-dependent peptidase
MVTDAQKALTDARMLLSRLSPSVEPLLFAVPMIILSDDDYQEKYPGYPLTALCSPNNFAFSESFFIGLSPQKRAGLVAHELLHGAFFHLSDPFIDRSIPFAEFRIRANIAQDIMIELMINELSNATKTSGGALRIEQNHPPNLIKEYKKYAKWSWISIYHDMRDKRNPIDMDKIKKMILDGHASGEKITPEATARWEAAIEESKEVAKSAGNKPGTMNITVPVIDSTIPWHTVVKDWLTSCKSPEVKSWAKPKRRIWASRGAYRPVNGARDSVLKLNVWVDTSGSMHDALSSVSGEFKSIAGMADEVCIVQYDYGLQMTSILSSQELESWEFGKFTGGGGTSVDKAIDELDEAKWEIDEGVIDRTAPILVFTDGEDSAGCYERLKKKFGQHMLVVLEKGKPKPLDVQNCVWMD